MRATFAWIPILVLVTRLAIGADAVSSSSLAWQPPFGLDRIGRSDPVTGDAFEAGVIAAATGETINPVDLGLILPPADWLVLGPGQKGHVRAAVFSSREIQGAKLEAWYKSRPSRRAELKFQIAAGVRAEFQLELPNADLRREKDVLCVAIHGADGAELFRKSINVMLVRRGAELPKFGATETLLRYDMPISVRDPKTGTFTTMAYDKGWAPELQDVVVSLPNGSRFVFWRGSSYIPFWSGRHGTGFCYEWAEAGPPRKDAVDCVEPLMDKELRYGRVKIVESTVARVHVRWTYQSCDFNYKVWGDLAQEDYYFYPDGFGTRVLTLCSPLDSDYEVSEFIALAPAEGYPLALLPPNPVRSLALDGTAGEIPIPYEANAVIPPGGKPPLVYRARFHKDESETAIYFNPRDPFRVDQLTIFRPFQDKGQEVTPAYWGSHWPLARGNSTGGAIDERIHISPSHNSLMSWAHNRPEPVWSATGMVVDTLGNAVEKRTQRWVWMIGVTGETDGELLERARSFAAPSSLGLEGAEAAIDSYCAERRAYRLNVTGKRVEIVVKPGTGDAGLVACVNPVFELANAGRRLKKIVVGGRELERGEYAWDGATLWIAGVMREATRVELEFK